MDVSLFIPKRIYNDLIPLFESGNNNLKIILKKEDENDWRFLSRVKKTVELDFDLIFINTIQGKKTISFFSNQMLRQLSQLVVSQNGLVIVFHYLIKISDFFITTFPIF